jgi:hypothetical protein
MTRIYSKRVRCRTTISGTSDRTLTVYGLNLPTTLKSEMLATRPQLIDYERTNARVLKLEFNPSETPRGGSD